MKTVMEVMFYWFWLAVSGYCIHQEIKKGFDPYEDDEEVQDLHEQKKL